MNNYFRPRRSMLYVPGCNQHYLEKARSLQVDSIILDLGAPILLSAKETSRDNVVAALKQGGYGQREVVVRVNDLDSEWGYDDVRAVAGLGADAILFSNIENHDDVMNAISALDESGAHDTPIMVMIESPLAVLHAEEIAKASDRIACMVLATSDLISDLHARTTLERTAIRTSLSWVVLAARAYGRAVIDGINSDLKDMQAFEFACRIGRDMGFDGKSLVHPFQLPYANDAYTPKPVEVESAKEIIAALSAANAAGRGTVLVNGKLVEHHHVTAAKRFLNLSEMITQLELDND
ncbi:HpcH/HpaI aldolase/citrate lyase family protein [Methylophaga sp. OBS4]|uniref:HpcH/HpaI aldolase/citrate lyase family protein n=1 Tax=Methylophaga sp. OBS4 TaxID=2991935 RepID=UPI00224D26F9|nr:CoA ester lyase [Methylophaga sp. OBS4]MCX4186503.1 CoA ester lyase [Methylophaga sp. OBS4]